MNLKSLRQFCAAYEAGSTTAAAQQVHVSQSVISSAIAQLEHTLGVRLFERHARGLDPTPHGHQLYQRARGLLSEADSLLTAFSPREAAKCLRLSVHPALSAAHVGRFLRQLQDAVPQADLHVVAGTEGADVWLTAQSCASATVPFWPLWSEQYMLALPLDHPLVRQPHVSLDDLNGQPFIERAHCELSQSWQLHLGSRGIQPRIKAHANSEEWALELVASGLGLTVIPSGSGRRRPDVVFRDDVPELSTARRVVGVSLLNDAVACLMRPLLGPGAVPTTAEHV